MVALVVVGGWCRDEKICRVLDVEVGIGVGAERGKRASKRRGGGGGGVAQRSGNVMEVGAVRNVAEM